MNKISKIAVLATASAGLITSAAGAASAATAGTVGNSSNSPGVVSGNTIQIPVDAPINVCGLTDNVDSDLNPTSGDVCENN